jgi:hypothetical protein
VAEIVGICNKALIALGEDTIASLTDANKRARLCTASYASVRDRVTRARPWRCAMARATLAAEVTGPAFGFANSYVLPPDCLRVFDLPDADDNGTNWQVEGRKLLTDFGPAAKIVYIRRLDDASLIDSLLADAISYSLGAEIGGALTQSLDRVKYCQAQYEALLRDGELVSSQEASVQELDADLWLRSRV